jgi:hypothetical protein
MSTTDSSKWSDLGEKMFLSLFVVMRVTDFVWLCLTIK